MIRSRPSSFRRRFVPLVLVLIVMCLVSLVTQAGDTGSNLTAATSGTVNLPYANRGKIVTVRVGTTIKVTLSPTATVKNWTVPFAENQTGQLTRIAGAQTAGGGATATFVARSVDSAKTIIAAWPTNHRTSGGVSFSVAIIVVAGPTPTPTPIPTSTPTAPPTPTAAPTPSPTGPPPPPISGAAGDGTIGALTFEENFVTPSQPLVNTTGGTPSGVQACNWGFPGNAPNCGVGGAMVGNSGKWFGNWFPSNGVPLPTLGGTTNYAELDLTVPKACPTSAGVCRLEAVDNGGPHIAGTWQQGQTTYETGAVWVPRGGRPSSLNKGYKIGAYHFENVMNGEPIQVGLFQDHINLWGDTGACGSRATYCQWHIKNDDNLGSWPTGTTYKLPAEHIIPVGAEVQGAWNEYILKVKWESDATGTVDAWYRSYNGTTHTPWVHSLSLTGMATVQYFAGGSPANATWNANPLLYGNAVTVDTAVDEAGFADATGFGAAASALP